MRAALFLLAACASAPLPPQSAVPAWTAREHWIEDGFVYSVADSSIRKLDLALSSADLRASHQIARVWDVFFLLMAKRYADSNHPAVAIDPVEPCEIESGDVLSQIEIVEQWRHPDGRTFSLARLDLRPAVTCAVRMLLVGEQARRRMEQAADEAYAVLADVPVGTYSKLARSEATSIATP